MINDESAALLHDPPARFRLVFKMKIIIKNKQYDFRARVKPRVTGHHRHGELAFPNPIQTVIDSGKLHTTYTRCSCRAEFYRASVV